MFLENLKSLFSFEKKKNFFFEHIKKQNLVKIEKYLNKKSFISKISLNYAIYLNCDIIYVNEFNLQDKLYILDLLLIENNEKLDKNIFSNLGSSEKGIPFLKSIFNKKIYRKQEHFHTAFLWACKHDNIKTMEFLLNITEFKFNEGSLLDEIFEFHSIESLQYLINNKKTAQYFNKNIILNFIKNTKNSLKHKISQSLIENKLIELTEDDFEILLHHIKNSNRSYEEKYGLFYFLFLYNKKILIDIINDRKKILINNIYFDKALLQFSLSKNIISVEKYANDILIQATFCYSCYHSALSFIHFLFNEMYLNKVNIENNQAFINFYKVMYKLYNPKKLDSESNFTLNYILITKPLNLFLKNKKYSCLDAKQQYMIKNRKIKPEDFKTFLETNLIASSINDF